MIVAKRYTPLCKVEWDKFVSTSRNGHFMFYRDYMEYHSDRFSDYSLMFYDDKNRLISIFPANIFENSIYSHQGLTFGGMLIGSKCTTEKVCEIFFSAKSFLKKDGRIKKIIYKRIPDFYHKYPAQEDLYALYLLDAELSRRDVSVAVDMSHHMVIRNCVSDK